MPALGPAADLALDEAGRLVGAVGRVLPATMEPVVLKADVEGAAVEGQVAVANSRGIGRLEIVPADAAVCPDAVAAIRAADQVVIAPGSLFEPRVTIDRNYPAGHYRHKQTLETV